MKTTTQNTGSSPSTQATHTPGEWKASHYRVITDAVSVEIEAKNTDEAARKFAKSEALFRGLGIESEADLMDEIAKMGGWCNIVEA